jgi:RNA polymerase sigma factor (TIGR02999 family)
MLFCNTPWQINPVIRLMIDDADLPSADITGLLQAARGGDRGALQRLYPLVYEQLLALARRHRRRWHGDPTLNTTAIAHEAYLKLAGTQVVAAENRMHFFAIAARAMRQILCNYARDRRRLKRGGGAVHLDLDSLAEVLPIELPDARVDELAALDEALKKLATISERQCQVVECRFFADMSIEETAQALQLSPATVKRDWAMASAWLYREIQGAGLA